MLFRGVSSRFNPVDVAMRLLQATTGWVVDGGEVERWQTSLQSSAPGEAIDWLMPARDDDASWMLPFVQRWGSNQAWLVYARAEPEDVAKVWLQLNQSGAPQGATFPLLSPFAIADFLANRSGTVVQRFFAPLDAILLEVHCGERWALFGRRDLESCLQDLNFVDKPIG
jgi:hypothetical protein